eukprot:c8366_g1_i1.p1 GENE.c8366_g1_i1~~c8366_g1_i1.p1  ORF type:complete len:261 (+),score=26.50 c8366_g1_i1:30-785(+)
MVRVRWSNEEDERLVQIIQSSSRAEGISWHKVASKVTGKTSRQCRERWKNVLDPNLNRGPWSSEEDQILIRELARVGRKWAEIAKALPGRTDIAVKNRANSLDCRRYSGRHQDRYFPHQPSLGHTPSPPQAEISESPTFTTTRPNHPSTTISPASFVPALSPRTMTTMKSFESSVLSIPHLLARRSALPDQRFSFVPHDSQITGELMARLGREEPRHSEEYLSLQRRREVNPQAFFGSATRLQSTSWLDMP